jgi:hypothetical protein
MQRFANLSSRQAPPPKMPDIPGMPMPPPKPPAMMVRRQTAAGRIPPLVLPPSQRSQVSSLQNQQPLSHSSEQHQLQSLERRNSVIKQPEESLQLSFLLCQESLVFCHPSLLLLFLCLVLLPLRFQGPRRGRDRSLFQFLCQSWSRCRFIPIPMPKSPYRSERTRVQLMRSTGLSGAEE